MFNLGGPTRRKRMFSPIVTLALLVFTGVASAQINNPSCTVPPAAGTNCPHSWATFAAQIQPFTVNGASARDPEGGSATDPTNGGASFSSDQAIASGKGTQTGIACNPNVNSNCGNRPSAFYAYYNGGTVWDGVANSSSFNDDYIFIRMRIEADPRASNGFDFSSGSHWNFLLDIDNDGYKELWVDVFGNNNRVRLLYQNNASQQVGGDNQANGTGSATTTYYAEFLACADPSSTSSHFTGLQCLGHSMTRAVTVASVDATDTCGGTCTGSNAQWFVDVQVPVWALTNNSGTLNPAPTNGNSFTATQTLGATQICPPTNAVSPASPCVTGNGTQIGFFFSTSNSSTNPLQKDFVANCNAGFPNATCVFSDPTPVSVSYFQATQRGKGTHIDWSTASETANVGFNIYGGTPGTWTKLNPRLVPSKKFDSLARVDYEIDVEGAYPYFYIADVNANGVARRHGPYEADKSHGGRQEPRPIDWKAIRAESQGKALARGRAEREAAAALVKEAATTNLSIGGYPAYDLKVDKDGIYRVSYATLAAAGLDLNGVAVGSIALTNKGTPVKIRVQPSSADSSKFGPGGFVEFYGTAVSSLYTKTNVYRLAVNAAQAQRVAVDATAPGTFTPAPWYTATATVENQNGWTFAAPNGDPWYDEFILAFNGTPVSRQRQITVDNYVPSGGPGSVFVDVWGVTDFSGNLPDHHVTLSFNGSPFSNATFDGNVDAPATTTLAAGALQQGVNTLTVALPADTGNDYDLIALDKLSVTYPRAFVAQNGGLTFKAAAGGYLIKGLPNATPVVYRMSGSNVQLVTGLKGEGSGANLKVGFRGGATLSTYAVSAVGSLLTPTLEPTHADDSIIAGGAQYLVIAHPDFLGNLTPLTNARSAQGLAVKVADVRDVYGKFSGGVVDPEAIRSYITYAAANLGTEYVLLVGGDTFDYFGYLGTGSVSFVPTFYRNTFPFVNFGPSDTVFADSNNDNVPEVAIGRLPVRSSAELDSVIAKTLAYATAPYKGTAVFSADAKDNNDFAQISDATAAQLQGSWSLQTAYIDTLGLAGARSALIGAINGGVGLTNYIGHSDVSYLSFGNLFTDADANGLTNAGKPTVVLQWGCWNAFYPTTDASSVADRFLLAGDRGAAAVVGPSGLTTVDADRQLSAILARKLTEPGATLGKALAAAKAELAIARFDMIDVLLGVNLLGDPALGVTP